MRFLHVFDCARILDISADQNVWPRSALRSFAITWKYQLLRSLGTIIIIIIVTTFDISTCLLILFFFLINFTLFTGNGVIRFF